jgi:hypothetical protein
MVKLLTFALLFVALLFSVSYAQGYGKSVILVNTTSISAQPGATVQVGYTVKLYRAIHGEQVYSIQMQPHLQMRA